MLARLAAAVFYGWNPYVAERLVIGQWALLLGYAGLPWVLRAVLRLDASMDASKNGGKHDSGARRAAARLALALLPAVIGGFAAMAITAVMVMPMAIFTRRPRTIAVALGAIGVGSLPWLIPAGLHTVYADPAGVAAFAALADTPFGSLGSLVMLGGSWNATTVPRAYGGPWSAIWLALVLAAIVGYALLAGRRRRWPGLATGAVAGLVIAAIGVTAPGRALLRGAIGFWPGFAILRDGQQFTAPLALAEAAGFGLAVAWSMHPGSFGRPRPDTERPGGKHRAPALADAPGVALGVFALLAPVLGLVLSGLGTCLIVFAVLMPTWVSSKVLKFPLNEYATATLAASNASCFSPTKLTELTGVNMEATETIKGNAAAGSSSTAVWNQSQGAQALLLLDANLVMTPASVNGLVALDNSQRSKMTLVTTTLPLVTGIVGVILLIVGILLSRRREDVEGASATFSELAAAEPEDADRSGESTQPSIVPGLDDEPHEATAESPAVEQEAAQPEAPQPEAAQRARSRPARSRRPKPPSPKRPAEARSRGIAGRSRG